MSVDDFFFTNVPLEIHRLDTNFSVAGPLRQHIPKEMRDSKSRELCSSLFCFTKHITMASYAPKKTNASGTNLFSYI